MEGIYEVYLKRSVIKKMVKVYKHIDKIEDLEELDLSTISSIRKKLVLAYHRMKKLNKRSVIIKLSIYEYRYFLKIADAYLKQYHKSKDAPCSSVQNEFDQFIDKGANDANN